jgi:hypothetical protein
MNTNNTQSFPIVVPTDWSQKSDYDHYLKFIDNAKIGECRNSNLEADQAQCVESIGSSQERCQSMLLLLGQNYRDLNAAVDNALVFYLSKLAQPRSELMAALALPEKIDWLQALIRAESSDPDYLNEMSNLLAACSLADSERHRVLTNYQTSPDETCLFPLCQLSDCLVQAGKELEFIVILFNEGHYCQPIVYHHS